METGNTFSNVAIMCCSNLSLGVSFQCMCTINQLQELVRTLHSRINELENELSVARGTAAGIREAYSITKRMQSDWERIDGMDSTIRLQSEHIHILQRHIKKLEGILENEGLGEYIPTL